MISPKDKIAQAIDYSKLRVAKISHIQDLYRIKHQERLATMIAKITTDNAAVAERMFLVCKSESEKLGNKESDYLLEKYVDDMKVHINMIDSMDLSTQEEIETFLNSDHKHISYPTKMLELDTNLFEFSEDEMKAILTNKIGMMFDNYEIRNKSVIGLLQVMVRDRLGLKLLVVPENIKTVAGVNKFSGFKLTLSDYAAFVKGETFINQHQMRDFDTDYLFSVAAKQP